MILTNDLKHKFAVEEFQKVSLKYLSKQGFKPSKIIQFCDNFSGQYKSKECFELITQSEISVLRCYFGSHHGKGPVDGPIRCATIAANNARKCGEAIIRDGFEFFFFKFILQKNSWEKSKMRNFQTKMFVDKIDRCKWLCSVTIKGMQKFHTVRSTGNTIIIECRNDTCLCHSHLWEEDTQCPNVEYVDRYQSFNL